MWMSLDMVIVTCKKPVRKESLVWRIRELWHIKP